jgi:hypothetical protein
MSKATGSRTATSRTAKTTATAPNGNPEKPVTSELHEAIRHRAYELFVERGGHPGHEHEDWLRAEKEVRARHGLK